MKSIAISIIFSVATFFLVLDYLDKNQSVIMQQTLPAVEIKAPSVEPDTTEQKLPEVIISAKRSKFTFRATRYSTNS